MDKGAAFFFVDPPGLEPFSYITEYQYAKKSEYKNDYDFHCEMFDSKKMSNYNTEFPANNEHLSIIAFVLKQQLS